MNYKHAVIAMKALPFHLGHEFLIRSAQAQSERVTILLVWSANQWPPVEKRYEAIRQTFPDVRVIPVVDLHTDDNDPSSHVQWANYARSVILDDIDVVFSSEEYGWGWANALGVKHVLVDLPRTTIPVSGTEIRNDPYLYWHYINRYMRLYYLKRVLVVGPESTGKTTLCKNLSLKYSTFYTPEYGRIYDEQTRKKNEPFDEESYSVFFANVVNTQPYLAQQAEQDARLVCFYDTDLLTTAIWYEEWQSAEMPMYEDIWAAHEKFDPKYDLILISDPNTTWVDDGYRGQSEDVRHRFYNRLADEYLNTTSPLNVKFLHGSWDDREAAAIRAVNGLFRQSRVTLP